MTGLSDLAFPPDSMGKWGEDRIGGGTNTNSDNSNNSDGKSGGFASLTSSNWQFTLQRYMGSWTTGLFAFAAFLSPIVMVAIPQMNVIPLTERQLRCDVECDGFLISFGFKLFILLAGTWAVFFRNPKATLPRIYLYRSIVCFVIAILVFSFWLFYVVKIVTGEERRRVQVGFDKLF